jgi:SAM-dependent methyltransferase
LLTTGGWRNFAGVYGRLRPPLRPSPIDVANLSRAISHDDKRILLLGVTPELSVLGRELTAVDNSPSMLARVWPGDQTLRRAVIGDWTNLPFADATFDAAIGDGSLNSAPEVVDEVLAEVKRVLVPEGKAAFRLFCAPEEPETLESIADDLGAGWPGNLHALKWRIAMTLAASKPRAIVPVQEILVAFNRMFPDRTRLAAGTGWSPDDIATLDAYVGADHSLGFPTLSTLLRVIKRHFSDVSVVAASGYPLAGRCPTVICGERA